jgi:hypothetical protein
MFLTPRALIYLRIPEYYEGRLKELKSKAYELQPKRYHSGEIDYPFRVRVIGIEDIGSVFTHYEHHCYYNGKNPPSFISFYPKKEV